MAALRYFFFISMLSKFDFCLHDVERLGKYRPQAVIDKLSPCDSLEMNIGQNEPQPSFMHESFKRARRSNSSFDAVLPM